jgi:hypothetical protein
MQILFVRLFKKILRANNFKLKTEGSNAHILQLRFLAAYTEYKPILAPISQSTDSEGIAFIDSSFSGLYSQMFQTAIYTKHWEHKT